MEICAIQFSSECVHCRWLQPKKLGFERYIKSDALVEPESTGCSSGGPVAKAPFNKWKKYGWLPG